MIKKNTWVQIHKVILSPNERAVNLPDDSKLVPLEMWVKGFLQEPTILGEKGVIKTLSGRIEEGIVVAINPSFMHNYGDFVPEIIKISQFVKKELYGDCYDG